MLLDPIERNVYHTHWPIARAASAFNRAFLTSIEDTERKARDPAVVVERRPSNRERVDLGYIPSPDATPGEMAL